MNRRTRTFAASSLAVLMAGATAVWAQEAITITADWAGVSQHFAFFTTGGTATPGVINESARVLQMQLRARPRVGPNAGVSIRSAFPLDPNDPTKPGDPEKPRLLHYGTYSSRLKTADCSAQPNAGVVTGLFTFFNDEKDHDGDGLIDNSEIDFEWLCAKPEEVYLTMWTDFHEPTGAQQRVLRYINLKTGTIIRRCYFEEFGFANCDELDDDPGEDEPAEIPKIADYEPHKKFYTYGFTWSEKQVVWWIVDPSNSSNKLVLWNYTREDRIPKLPSQFMTNIWHSTGFFPLGMPTAKQKPRVPISQFIDLTMYEPKQTFP
jgi:hypothetical protein